MVRHSDPTANEAIGAVNREWKQMARLALRIRNGHDKSAWAAAQEKKFTGIYKRMLTDSVETLRASIGEYGDY